MKYFLSIITGFLIAILLLTISCRSKKESGALVYRPVFDQTQSRYAPTPDRASAELDTSVLIRSNLKSEFVHRIDTFNLFFDFLISKAELKIGTEELNEKPPRCDTLLVLRNYHYRREWAEARFPERTDTVMVVSDPLAMGTDLSETYYERDIFTKPFLSRNEIMMFQNRNFATADSVFNEASTYAPFDRGDTIPFQPSMNLLYYEGNLLLVFDTVFVYTREPVRQFTMRQLLAQKKEPVAHHKQLVYDDVVEFRRYYPHEEDVFIDMIRVVGGTFKMGSNEFDEDERPQTSLSVSSFLISKYEITNKLFCYFLNDEKVAPDGTLDEVKLIHFDGKYTKIYFSRDSLKFYPNTGFEDYPVVNVTWYGAQRFARFAVPVEEKKFSSNQGRLPSEVEWEYAARGGAFARKKLVNWDFSDYEYPYRFAGGDYLPQLAAFVDNSMGYCHQVGRFFPNELGIYDMSGNVWEWCYDKYNPDFLKRVGQSRDPMNLTGADYRVAKGGSWSSDAMYCRITNRNSLAATEHNPFLGFRLWKSW